MVLCCCSFKLPQKTKELIDQKDFYYCFCVICQKNRLVYIIIVNLCIGQAQETIVIAC